MPNLRPHHGTRKRVRPSVIAPVRPAVLAERDAATYIGKSPSWMRQRRFRDIALARLKKEPDGPAWIQVESSIMYEVSALDAWLASKRIDRGQVEFRGKARARALDTPDSDPEGPLR